MILKNSSGSAAEIAIHLGLAPPGNPATPVTGHTWLPDGVGSPTTGELQIWWPSSGAFVNTTIANILEQGFGDYTPQGTVLNTALAGCAYVYANALVAEPFRDVEFIVDPADPAIQEVPFFLVQASNPVYGEIVGHSFTSGEVQLRFSTGGYFAVPTSQIVERGHGMYAVVLTQAQRANVNKVFISAQVSGAQPFTADWDMVVSTFIGVNPIAPSVVPAQFPTPATLPAGVPAHVALALARLPVQFQDKQAA